VYPQFGQTIEQQPTALLGASLLRVECRRATAAYARPVTWRRATTVLGSVAVVALAGCATPGYSPSRIESELVRAGATRDQARCVTQALSDTYDERQLGSHSEPGADEVAKVRLILERCKVTLPLQPLP
jgi:hypothetical protein